jgi:hypothetical protein
MSWGSVLLEEDDPAAPLADRVDALFAQQRAGWGLFRSGEAALVQLRSKRLSDGAASIVVQANPARRRSTHARVDQEGIAARPCFLCPASIPPEERGIPFEEFIVLPNPYPILRMHCTLAHREHQPQRLMGRVGELLRCAWAAGPSLLVFYNGPRCGASAPDHYHLQACGAGDVPLLQEMAHVEAAPRGTVHQTFGRSLIAFCGATMARLETGVEKALAKLRAWETDNSDVPVAEPMVNIMAHRGADRSVVLLFPRRAHRPACYFSEGPERLAVSPAALEMSGVLVSAEAGDVDRIDGARARAIYEEVSVSSDKLNELFV